MHNRVVNRESHPKGWFSDGKCGRIKQGVGGSLRITLKYATSRQKEVRIMAEKSKVSSYTRKSEWIMDYMVQKTKEAGRKVTYAEAKDWHNTDPTAPMIQEILYAYESFDEAAEEALVKSGLGQRPVAAVRRPLAKVGVTAKVSEPKPPPVVVRKSPSPEVMAAKHATKEKFLKMLAEIVADFGRIPTVSEFEDYVQQRGLPTYGKFVAEIGTRSDWRSQLRAAGLGVEKTSTDTSKKPTTTGESSQKRSKGQGDTRRENG